LKSQRDFRNYLAGAALAFGVVLLALQIMIILFSGMNETELQANDSLIWNMIYGANLVGGLLGGYLVARHRKIDYIQTGTVVAALAYIFEIIYSVVLEKIPLDIWSTLSLLIGGIFGSMFFRAQMERKRIAGLKMTEENKPSLEPQEKNQD
jgi:hypothetical protein